MNLVLDFGNTKIKAAVFSEMNGLLETFVWEELNLDAICEICKNYEIDSAILCSVVDVPTQLETYLKTNLKQLKQHPTLMQVLQSEMATNQMQP